MKPSIQLATTDSEIEACFPVMRELRPPVLEESTFVAQVRHLQQKHHYQLAYMLDENGTAVSVAGFRMGENLASGKHVYLEDLVTASNHRRQGYGKQLLDWIKAYGQSNACKQVLLDSKLHRIEAHAFYEREHMHKAGYHFYCSLQSHDD